MKYLLQRIIFVSLFFIYYPAPGRVGAAPVPFFLRDTAVLFLWKEPAVDKDNKDTVISFNKNYALAAPPQVKAALGFLACSIGSNCHRQHDAQGKAILRCAMLEALGLDTPCSDKHLSFLKKWFTNDVSALKEIRECNAAAPGDTVTDNFDRIWLSVRHDTITVICAAHGDDRRACSNWSWLEQNIFKYDEHRLWHIDRQNLYGRYDDFLVPAAGKGE